MSVGPIATLAPARSSGATPVRSSTAQLGLQRIQPKLTVHPIGDPFEIEADRIAEDVANRNTSQAVDRVLPPPSITPVVQRAEEMPAVEEEDQDDQETPESNVQRVAAAAADDDDDDANGEAVQRDAAAQTNGGTGGLARVEQLLTAREGHGQPLSADTRRTLEPRFGVDFSHVRIHTDAEASGMADDLSAVAFTHGRDIYFRNGAYAPQTKDGTRLLAHELTHVVQQGGGAVGRVQRNWLEVAKRYIGKGVHKDISPRFRDHPKNTGLITDAPIPGGGEGGHYPDDPKWFGKVGRPDFYKTKDAPKIAGIRGAFPKGQEGDMSVATFEELTPHRDMKPKVSNRGPVLDASGTKASGTFPANIEVADLKPLAESKVGEGLRQIANYKDGFKNVAAEANKKFPGVGSPTVTPMTSLVVPEELDYQKIDSQPKTTTNKPVIDETDPAGPMRMWIAQIPGGVVAYFPMPHPDPGLAQGDVNRVFKLLDPIPAKLRADKQPITTKAPAIARKALPGARSQPARARVQRTPNKQDPNVWGKKGHDWEVERSNWADDKARPLLEGPADKTKGTTKKGLFDFKGIALIKSGTLPSAIHQRHTVDKVLTKHGVSLPGKAPLVADLGKKIERIAFWAGPKGRVIGALRFKLGSTFTRIANFFEDKKERFEKAHAKVKGPSTYKPGFGWVKKLLNVLLPIMKQAFGLFLVASFEVFKACFNTLIHKLVDSFVDDVSEEVEAQLKKLDEEFHKFEAEFRKLFEERLGKLDEFAEIMEDVNAWRDTFTGLEVAIRLIVQIISCGTPPALGCLWGLVAQLTIDLMVDLVMNTEIFQQQLLNPLVRDLVNQYASPWYKQLIAEVIENSGSTELKKLAVGVTECRPQKTEKLLEGLPSGSGLSGSALDEHRKKWEKSNEAELLEGVRNAIKGKDGNEATSDDVKRVLEDLKKSQMTLHELRSAAEKLMKPDGKASPDEFGERMRKSGLSVRELKKLARGESSSNIIGPKTIEWPDPPVAAGSEGPPREGDAEKQATKPAEPKTQTFYDLFAPKRPSHEEVDVLGKAMKDFMEKNGVSESDMVDSIDKMDFSKPGGDFSVAGKTKGSGTPKPPPLILRGDVKPGKPPLFKMNPYDDSTGPPPIFGPKQVPGTKPGEEQVTPGVTIPLPF